MTTSNNPLAAVLDALNEQIQTGTFTLDAVKRVDELRQKSEELAKTNDKLAQEKADLLGRLSALQKDHDVLKSAAGNLTDRETKVKAAETQIAVDKKELELTKLFKDDLKTIVHTALRSPIVQKTMNDVVAVPGGGNMCGFTTPVVKTETTQEV